MNWEKLLRKRGFWIGLVGVLFLITPIFFWQEFYWEDYFRGLGIWLLPSFIFYSAGILVWVYSLGLMPYYHGYYGIRLTDSILMFAPLLSIAGWIAFGVFLKNIKKVKRVTLLKVLFFILLIAIIVMVGCTKIDYGS